MFGQVSARLSMYNPDRIPSSTYDQMMTDSTIKSCVSLQRFALKRMDWDVVGRDPEVCEFVRAVLSPIWGHILDSCAYGIAYGCAPNELVWERSQITYKSDEEPITKDGWRISKVKDIKPSSLHNIIVDGLENFAGYTVSVPTMGQLPADKCFHYVHDMTYGNYWGNARLKAAYSPWYSREILNALYLRFMERRVVPAVHVEYPPGFASDGTTANATIARNIATGFQSDSTAIWTESVVDGLEKWDVRLVEDAARAQTAEAFLSGIKSLKLEIMTAVLTPEKILNGDAGAFALSETHKDVWILGIEGTLEEILEEVNDQLVPRIVRYNFGDVEMPRLVPAALAESTKSILANIFNLAIAEAPLDLDAIAERLDVPMLEGDERMEWEAEKEKAKAAMEEMRAKGFPGQNQENDGKNDPQDEGDDGEPPEAKDDKKLDETRQEAARLREDIQTARLRLASRV